ncbi:MAG TPA: hypothetical protein DCE80_08530 [Ignavibacteriales bacterium]|nr:hypothetical protein [Ignavibacteriales bacterium]
MTETYLLDSCIVIELLRERPKVMEWLESISEDSNLAISGWTLLELMKEKTSKQEMTDVIAKLQSYQILWPSPDKCNEVPSILIQYYHTERDTAGKLKGNAIFDALIYVTAKSYSVKLVTMNGGFGFVSDITVIRLPSS